MLKSYIPTYEVVAWGFLHVIPSKKPGYFSWSTKAPMAFITASDFPQLYAVVFGEGVLNDAARCSCSPGQVFLWYFYGTIRNHNWYMFRATTEA